ncbi:MAG: gliding motility-associated C-terminal domain-containing protein [Bacteroidetes bacterium]|nr:gliding motility-associated C-terminal domain-containing protein [Bacteroidota bacterium]
MLPRKILSFLLFAACIINPFFSISQLNKWLVPESNGLLHLVDFTVSPPEVTVPIANYGIGAGEEVNLITDPDDNILFSFVGINNNYLEVRNRNWSKMPNGEQLRGHRSVLESCIVPVPCSTSEFYIIHSNILQEDGWGNLYYSRVNMNLNNGLGDVEEKNSLLGSGNYLEGKDVSHMTEKGCRWLLAAKMEGDDVDLVRFLITSDDIIDETVLYRIKNFSNLEIDLSPDNTKLALSACTTNPLYRDIVVFDFDLESGTVSNIREYDITTQNLAGIEFSESGKFLYWRTNFPSEGSILGRINLSNNQVEVIDSYMGSYATGIEKAGNGKIFINKSTSQSYLAEISNPDAENIADIGFTKDAVFISGNGLRSGVPDAIEGEIPGTFYTPSYINFDIVTTGTCNEFQFIENGCLATYWEWDFGDGITAFGNNVIHQYLLPGIYPVELKIRSCNDTLTLIKEIEVNESYTLNLGNDTAICGSIDMVLHAGSGFMSYLWSNGTMDSVCHVNSPGVYWVHVLDSLSCVGTDTIEISQEVYPDIELGQNFSICPGDSALLSAGSGYNSYLWQDGSEDSIMFVHTAGIYYVTVANSCGEDSDTIQIDHFNVNPVNIGNDTSLCEGQSILLNPGNLSGQILWQDSIVSNTYLAYEPGLYWVRYQDMNGCYIYDTMLLDIIYLTELFLGNDTIVCPGTSIWLEPGSGFNSYIWNDASTNSYLIVSQPGEYWVKGYMQDCYTSDTIIINDCNSSIFVPNCFTPNGDGINDYFFAKGINILDFEMYIFNRWGQQLFESNSIDDKWDGKFKNTLCPQGVYYYLIYYKTTISGNDENESPLKGSVTLLRN